MTPVTPAQTTQILSLLAQGDLTRHQIAERLGVTPGQVIAVKAVSGRDKGENAETDEAIGDAIELTFSLERDLQRALRGNIAQLVVTRTVSRSIALWRSLCGTLVAPEFSPRAIAAARAAPNIQLVKYGFRFSTLGLMMVANLGPTHAAEK